jgi:serine/threonine-protein kinase
MNHPVSGNQNSPDDPLEGETLLPDNERRSGALQEGSPIFSQRFGGAGPAFDLTDLLILEKLGTGSVGTVYRAHQVSRNLDVALKVLSRELASQPIFVERFYREAVVMDRLDHPNIVRFYGAGEMKGLPFLAMEFVDGFTLRRVLQSRKERLPLGQALVIVLQCVAALGYAHQRHIVHRDIKPGNIMLTRTGKVKLTDLGLAKPLDGRLDLTQSGVGMGTPEYVAPEQARDARQADHRSDLYALGVVLYELLTGELPFRPAAAVELLLAKEQGEYPAASRVNPQVPPRLDRVLARMLAVAPGQRYQDHAELICDLRGSGKCDAGKDR